VEYKVVEFTVKVLVVDTEEAGGIWDCLTDALVQESQWHEDCVDVSWSQPTEQPFVKEKFVAEGWDDEDLFALFEDGYAGEEEN
jgi:hypothetical protein